MEIQSRMCRLCGTEIPAGRLKALPDTRVCVECSAEIGGEHVLEVVVTSTTKPGSLKRTGHTVSVQRKRKPDV